MKLARVIKATNIDNELEKHAHLIDNPDLKETVLENQREKLILKE